MPLPKEELEYYRKRKRDMQRMRRIRYTYQQIADKYGISRQRVKQIIG